MLTVSLRGLVQILRALGVRHDTWCRFCEATPQPALQRRYHDDILSMLLDFTNNDVDVVFDAAGAANFRVFRSQATSGPFQLLDRDVVTRLMKRVEYEPIAVHGNVPVDEIRDTSHVYLDFKEAKALGDSDETGLLAELSGVDVGEADHMCWWFHGTTWAEAIDICDGTGMPYEDGSLDFGPSGTYLGDSFPAAVDWSNGGWSRGQVRERAVVVFAIPEATRTAWVQGAAFAAADPPSAAWAHTVRDSRAMRSEVVYAPDTEANLLRQRGRAKKQLRMRLSKAVYGPVCGNPSSGSGSQHPEDVLTYYADKRSKVVMQLKVRAGSLEDMRACCMGIVFLREDSAATASTAPSRPSGGAGLGAGAGAGAGSGAGAGAGPTASLAGIGTDANGDGVDT